MTTNNVTTQPSYLAEQLWPERGILRDVLLIVGGSLVTIGLAAALLPAAWKLTASRG